MLLYCLEALVKLGLRCQSINEVDCLHSYRSLILVGSVLWVVRNDKSCEKIFQLFYSEV